MRNGHSLWPGITLVFSTIASHESIGNDMEMMKHPASQYLQRFDIEEADLKIIIHIFHCCLMKRKKVFILSTDTDVFVLALNFMSKFEAYGLNVCVS